MTFLLTDIEGSTALLERLGTAEYGRVLNEHRPILPDAFTRHGGVEVDTFGRRVLRRLPLRRPVRSTLRSKRSPRSPMDPWRCAWEFTPELEERGRAMSIADSFDLAQRVAGQADPSDG